MNKSEMVEAIAKQADLPKTKAEAALKAFIETTKKTLKKGGEVQLIGFGTFCVAKRSARTGRNPQTGEAIKIKASKLPKFKPGKSFKDAI
ncbi:MAG: HU family DNA-binding protein [Sutterella sp.]|nr:HU family DNA-binding protein [Sutterella sp.]